MATLLLLCGLLGIYFIWQAVYPLLYTDDTED